MTVPAALPVLSLGVLWHAKPSVCNRRYSTAGVCPRDASPFPEADTHGIACRPPKPCVGYNKEPWKGLERGDGIPGPQKMGMRRFVRNFVLEVRTWVDLINERGRRIIGLRLSWNLVFHI